MTNDLPAAGARKSERDEPISLAEGSGAADGTSLLRRLEARSAHGERYEIKGEIARGGMGAVLEIWDAELRRRLAMKLLPGGASADDPIALARFLEEAQVTGQLDHPGIVPVHELGVDAAGRVFFTMRLVRGRDLKKIIELVHAREEGWTLTRALNVILKVAEAMAYAHEKGVLHRDLKPANVMVGRFGEVYVMDWGVSKVVGRDDRRDLRVRADAALTRSQVRTERSDAEVLDPGSPLVTMDGSVIGTPAYMSPEQAAGRMEDVGPRSDVYSLGALLYHVLSGEMPYVPKGARVTAHTVWRFVLEGPPKPLHEIAREVPLELVAICERAMARDPAQRYPDMLALADDLHAYLDGRVVRAYETGALAELRKWVVRNRTTAVAGAAALVIAVVALMWTTIVQSRAKHEIAGAYEVAVANEQRALANERVAREETAKVLRLSDIRRVVEYETAAEALWPAVPAQVEALEAWLVRARELAANLPTHRESLVALRSRPEVLPYGAEDAEKDRTTHARGTELLEKRDRRSENVETLAKTTDAAKREEIEKRITTLDEQIAKLESEVSARRTWRFPEAETQWQHEATADLVARLERFTSSDPFEGAIASVEKRLELARTLEERSIASESAAQAWREAIATIADESLCPAYRGLRITPQLGLVPLGRDPRTGLFEFAHLASGEPPARNAKDELELVEKSGVVLVLVPGGTFAMGAQSADASAPNYDALAKAQEGPVNEVVLAPFLLSKFELTQAQWLRATGKNPSSYSIGRSFSGRKVTGFHPVEQISWNAASQTLARLDLELPTEAQWEYAARAGTSTPWSTGAVRDTLREHANLADQAAKREKAPWPTIDDWPELDDGFAVHAPIGSLHPNAFGLFDVHGNVWEWCRDGWHDGAYEKPVRGPDGERDVRRPRFRVNRGGSYASTAALARTSSRTNDAPDAISSSVGVRPSRALRR